MPVSDLRQSLPALPGRFSAHAFRPGIAAIFFYMAGPRQGARNSKDPHLPKTPVSGIPGRTAAGTADFAPPDMPRRSGGTADTARSRTGNGVFKDRFQGKKRSQYLKISGSEFCVSEVFSPLT
jgi:hypothetical protein